MKHHTVFERYLGFGFGEASPFHRGTFYGKPVFFRHGHGEGHGSAAKLRLKKFLEVFSEICFRLRLEMLKDSFILSPTQDRSNYSHLFHLTSPSVNTRFKILEE